MGIVWWSHNAVRKNLKKLGRNITLDKKVATGFLYLMTMYPCQLPKCSQLYIQALTHLQSRREGRKPLLYAGHFVICALKSVFNTPNRIRAEKRWANNTYLPNRISCQDTKLWCTSDMMMEQGNKMDHQPTVLGTQSHSLSTRKVRLHPISIMFFKNVFLGEPKWEVTPGISNPHKQGTIERYI